jgi:hypothetical protein
MALEAAECNYSKEAAGAFSLTFYDLIKAIALVH